MPSSSAIAVIVLNYGRAEDTIACAKSILEQKPFLLVLVDNASKDDSVHKLTLFGAQTENFSKITASNIDEARTKSANLTSRPSILLLSSTINGGYAAGNNLGITAAMTLGAKACWILNNDTLLLKGALQSIQNDLNERHNENLGLLGTKVLCGTSGIVQCLAGGYTNYWTGLSSQVGNGLKEDEARKIPREKVEAGLNYICGASVIATKNFLEKAGLMDERFFLYCEEQDWALRGKKLGFTLGFVPGAAIMHFEGSTTGMRPGSRPPSRMARLAISRLRLAAKHAPITIPTVATGLVFGLLRIYFRRFCKWTAHLSSKA